jgi:hypothetical protein
MTCDHSPDDLCLFCRPTLVPDGEAMLLAFMQKHGLRNVEHARALLVIEGFAPVKDPHA